MSASPEFHVAMIEGVSRPITSTKLYDLTDHGVTVYKNTGALIAFGHQFAHFVILPERRDS